MTTNKALPHLEFHVLKLNLLHIGAGSRLRHHRLTQVQLVQCGSLARVVQSHLSEQKYIHCWRIGRASGLVQGRTITSLYSLLGKR